MKMTLIPIIVCKFLAVKVIVLIQIFTFIDIKDILQIFTVDSFKKFCKIPKKTFRKHSMFVAASNFWFTTLLKMNSKLMFFLRFLQILLGQLFPIIYYSGCFYVFMTFHPYLVLKIALLKLFGKLSKIMWNIVIFYSYQVFLFKFCKNLINSCFSEHR